MMTSPALHMPSPARLSTRLDKVKTSPIVAIEAEIKRLRKAGQDVRSFSLGVPGFLPPQHVYDAARDWLPHDCGNYLPGRGVEGLLHAIAGRLKADGFDYDAESEICVQAGGKQALFNLMQILTGVGDKVLFPAPYWTSYADIVLLAGADFVAPACSAAQNYKLTPAQLQQALQDPAIKVFLFNNPSNPTGMYYTQAEVAALAEVLKTRPDVWIISDDIYDKLLFEGLTFPHLLFAAPELRERTILVNSVSKTYGMPGWRVGYAAGPKRVMDAMAMIVSQSVMNIPGVCQAAAAAAFSGDHGFLLPVLADLTRRRDKTLAVLQDLGDLACPTPQGAFYVFPDITALVGKQATAADGSRVTIEDDVSFCKAALAHAHVGVVPGSAFGMKNTVRLVYAGKAEDLQVGLARFAEFVAGLK